MNTEHHHHDDAGTVTVTHNHDGPDGHGHEIRYAKEADPIALGAAHHLHTAGDPFAAGIVPIDQAGL